MRGQPDSQRLVADRRSRPSSGGWERRKVGPGAKTRKPGRITRRTRDPTTHGAVSNAKLTTSAAV
jgi:hypothetical protein